MALFRMTLSRESVCRVRIFRTFLSRADWISLKKSGFAFGEGYQETVSLYDAQLLGRIRSVFLPRKQFEDDHVVTVMLFYLGQVVGIQDVLCGQEIDVEILAYLPDGGGVL